MEDNTVAGFGDHIGTLPRQQDLGVAGECLFGYGVSKIDPS